MPAEIRPVPKLPAPPSAAALRASQPELRVLPAGTELWRVHFAGGGRRTSWDSFRHYGPVASARFDPHAPPPRVQDRGIFYAADHGPTCLAEVFQETRVIDRVLREPWLVGFRLARPVAVLDCTGAWPTRAGASMNLSSGPRPRARAWARAIYQALPEVEGLYYPSSMHGNLPCVALFERSADALPGTPTFHRPLAHPALSSRLRVAAARLGYLLV